MAVVIEDLIQSIELLLKFVKKKQPYVNPNLDPVLLVPGVAGSLLTAVADSGHQERVWVRLLGADHEFRKKLWSLFDPTTGTTISLDQKTKIVVPEDRFGLYAVDVLDPDMIIGRDAVGYFHDMIEEMIKWGFQEGKTLFGFGYDFRQSNRLQETLNRFCAKLESVYTASGGKKLNIISHSMGGLLVKCFMSLHSDVFEKYVKSWIAIAAPFQGAPGYVTTSLLSGTSFVDGWEQNFFVSKWSMHQLVVECPSIYELMGCPDFDWSSTPLLQVWREKQDDFEQTVASFESYSLAETISVMKEALSNNTVEYGGLTIPLPFNVDILKWTKETRRLLSCAEVPPTVKFYNIFGTNNDTPHCVCYGSEKAPIQDLQQLLSAQPEYICVDGDGTVPAESAKADGLTAVARVAVTGDHRGILCDPHVFRILKHWLKAGDPDPYYNPLNDYVILPDISELANHRMEGLQITALREEWEIISEDGEDRGESVTSVSVSHTGRDGSHAEAACATVVVHPQNGGKKHVEVTAFGVSVGN